MRSRNDQHLFAFEEFVMQQLRKRAERDSLVEDVFQFHVAAGNRIPDHNQIRPGLKIVGIEGLRYMDPQIAQEFGHGRICSGIRSGDLKASLLQHSRQRSHGCAADADQVDVFVFGHKNQVQNANVAAEITLNRYGGLQNFYTYLLFFNLQLRFYTQRERDVIRSYVSGLQAVRNRNIQLADNSHDHFLQRVVLIGGLDTVDHLPEDQATDVLQFACEFQLHQHAIDLVGFGAYIFHEQDGLIRLDFVVGAERGDKDG